jgi:hypothetical protein
MAYLCHKIPLNPLKNTILHGYISELETSLTKQNQLLTSSANKKFCLKGDPSEDRTAATPARASATTKGVRRATGQATAAMNLMV